MSGQFTDADLLPCFTDRELVQAWKHDGRDLEVRLAAERELQARGWSTRDSNGTPRTDENLFGQFFLRSCRERPLGVV